MEWPSVLGRASFYKQKKVAISDSNLSTIVYELFHSLFLDTSRLT